MSLFVLGDIDPLGVGRFGGFDQPQFTTLVRLLSDGGAGPHEVLQSSGIPARQASLTGTLVEAEDVATLRGYDLSKEEVTFVDSNGNSTTVRVLELTIGDQTYWWDFTCTLLATGDTEPPGP